MAVVYVTAAGRKLVRGNAASRLNSYCVGGSGSLGRPKRYWKIKNAIAKTNAMAWAARHDDLQTRQVDETDRAANGLSETGVGGADTRACKQCGQICREAWCYSFLRVVA